jgi:BASS family bile acid:Na+ symporter
MNAVAIIGLVLKISLFLTALGFGLKTTSTDAFYLFRKPGLLLRSVLAMNIIMPVIALLIAYNFALPPIVKVALVAISVSPLAPLFPKQPIKAGGREAYVIGLMLIASLLSIVLIPLTLKVLSSIIDRPVAVSIQAIVVTVLVSVIVPLLLGIATRHFAPAFTGKIVNAVTRIAQVLLIVSVVPVLLKMFPAIIHLVGDGTILAIAAFSIIGLLVGNFLGKPDPADRSVLALATATRHPAIAVSLASANLPDHKLVPAAILLYLLLNALIALPYQKWLRKDKIQM